METKEVIYKEVSEGFRSIDVDRPILAKLIKVMNDFNNFMDWSLLNDLNLALFLILFKAIYVKTMLKSLKEGRGIDVAVIASVVLTNLYRGRESFFDSDAVDTLLDILKSIREKSSSLLRLETIEELVLNLVKSEDLKLLDVIADSCIKQSEFFQRKVKEDRSIFN